MFTANVHLRATCCCFSNATMPRRGFMIIVNVLLHLIFLRETPVALDTLFLLQHTATDDAKGEKQHCHSNSCKKISHPEKMHKNICDISNLRYIEICCVTHLLGGSCPLWSLHSRCSCCQSIHYKIKKVKVNPLQVKSESQSTKS